MLSISISGNSIEGIAREAMQFADVVLGNRINTTNYKNVQKYKKDFVDLYQFVFRSKWEYLCLNKLGFPIMREKD